MVIARVEPLTTARALRGPFDYRIPPGMTVGVGSMLLVPFGPQRLHGVVVEMRTTSEIPTERLVEPLKALESGVPAELVSLGLWVGEEYCSTPARGLSLVLPPGTGRRRSAGVKRALVASLTDAGRAPTEGRLGERQRAVLDALRAGPLGVAALTRTTGAGHSTVRALESRGLVKIDNAEQQRRPDMTGVGARSDGSTRLTEAQEHALAAIIARMDAPPGGPPSERRLLLHGVTGSGKTEVYLRAAAAALERGQTAIVLVPEIALTPQTAARFEQRFGDQVAVLHSKLSAGERHDEWLRLRRGEARVCVGPRSAVFAPLTDLGLIVIDEEHDASYKQEGDPRYDARRVAMRRADVSGALLLAGSATPRPESWAALRRLSMPERVDGRGMPPVELVPTAGMAGALHQRTRDALLAVRDRGEKAIVMLNRRGWSNFLSCGSCGRVWGCPQCDVTLVMHRAAGTVNCHHCGHVERVPSACPDCGSVSVARHGAGTERLEAELGELMGDQPVFRLDADSAAGRNSIQNLLRRFDDAPAGVLVGTQMVAKGHDFPDVTLGVVLDADSTLRFPDFRAEERTFALVAQLAGRSGRGSRAGRVIVQSLDIDARSLRHAAAHDAEGFLTGELQRRELLRYPPFGHLIKVVCSSEEAGPEWEAAEAVVRRLDLPDATVLGPAPLFRRQGRERAQLLVKAPVRGRANAVHAVRRAVESAAADKKLKNAAISVDVDPQ